MYHSEDADVDVYVMYIICLNDREREIEIEIEIDQLYNTLNCYVISSVIFSCVTVTLSCLTLLCSRFFL